MNQKRDPFGEIATLIAHAGAPFPIVDVKRLLLRATGSTAANEEIAEAVRQLHRTLSILAETVREEPSGSPNFVRQDALDDLRALQAACIRQRRQAKL